MKLTLDEAKRRTDESGGSLYLRGTQITELPENLTVGGWLDLRGTQITELPENLTVGGSLDLRGTQITELPENLTVGGSLYLRGTQITELPENLTVGGSLYLSGTQITAKERKKVKRLNEGDYVEGRYLFADGILTHVRKRRALGEYTLYVGKIKGRNVVSDGKNYAHCGNIRDGIADLLFKSAKDRGADQYKGMSLDTEMSVEDAVTMYRIITGACRQGSENFVNGIKDKKEIYTIRECIEMTKGQYGAERFAAFFGA
ncbi:MAG: hypothetical protein IJ418_08875 [Clostridia bacterium]|nr:hypothetical protein [Clostridia bacterium]